MRDRSIAWPGWTLVALLLCACQSPPDTRVPAHVLRERHRDLELGQTLEQVRDQMGGLPVERPGHPEAPFPTPFRTAALRTPRGDALRVDVYLVAVRPAEGCPDFQYEDAPVAYLNRRVVALSWEEIEWRWREWGGPLELLRRLQDRFVCEDAGLPAPREAPGAPLDSRSGPSYISAPS